METPRDKPLPENQTNVQQCQDEQKRSQNSHSRCRSSADGARGGNKRLVSKKLAQRPAGKALKIHRVLFCRPGASMLNRRRGTFFTSLDSAPITPQKKGNASVWLLGGASVLASRLVSCS